MQRAMLRARSAHSGRSALRRARSATPARAAAERRSPRGAPRERRARSTRATPRLRARLLVASRRRRGRRALARSACSSSSIRAGTSTGAIRATPASRRSSSSRRPGAVVEPARVAGAEGLPEADDLVTSYGYAGRVLLARARFARAARHRIGSRARAPICWSATSSACRRRSRSSGRSSRAGRGARDAERALFDAAQRSVPLAPAALGVDVALEARWPRPRAEGEPLDGSLARARRCGAATRAAPRLAPTARVLPLRLSSRRRARAVRCGARRATGRLLASGSPARRCRQRPSPRGSRGVLALRDADGSARAVEIELPLPARARRGARSRAGASGALRRRLALRASLGGLGAESDALRAAGARAQGRRPRRARAAQPARGLRARHGLLAGVHREPRWRSRRVRASRCAAQRHAVGWGFQLQEPLFVAAIASVLVTFALQPVRRLRDRRRAATARRARRRMRHGAARSFFDGLLAVVLATPCSAPFLGTAVGFAFASPAGVICVAIFARDRRWASRALRRGLRCCPGWRGRAAASAAPGCSSCARARLRPAADRGLAALDPGRAERHGRGRRPRCACCSRSASRAGSTAWRSARAVLRTGAALAFGCCSSRRSCWSAWAASS